MNITIGRPYAISERGGRWDGEDFVYPSPEAVSPHQRLFVVCDGGDEQGERGMACEHFQSYFLSMLEKDDEPTAEFVQKALQYTEAHAGRVSALAALYAGASGVTLAHTGGSRIYHFREGRILYRTLGRPAEAEVMLIHDVVPGDCFFMCTDSLAARLSDKALLNLFGKQTAPEIIKDCLMESYEGQTGDNFAFYIIPVQHVQHINGYKQFLLTLSALIHA